MSEEDVASSGAEEAAAPARLPTHPGDLVAEKYEVEHILGAGGMGIVVSAVHLDLQERVAIKFMLPEVAVVPAAANRFLREAQATSRLKSERIARLHDVGRLADGTPFMVMELLEGETLDRVMDRERPMAVPTIVDLVLQACEPLEEAHRMGIVHRDVKPENLFLADRPGEGPLVKVLDFGISKVQASISITVASGMMGTATYTSPEQLKNPSDVGPAADVWSLGVILFEGLTGTLPYGGASFAEICANVLHEEPARARDHRPDLPAALEQVIHRCITKDDAVRITSMAELAGALAPFATEEGRALAARIVRRSSKRPEETPSAPPPPPVPVAVEVVESPVEATEASAVGVTDLDEATRPTIPEGRGVRTSTPDGGEARPSFAESITPLAMGHEVIEAPAAPVKRSRRGLVAGAVAALAAAAAVAAFVGGPGATHAAFRRTTAAQPAPAAAVAPRIRAIAARVEIPIEAPVPTIVARPEVMTSEPVLEAGPDGPTPGSEDAEVVGRSAPATDAAARTAPRAPAEPRRAKAPAPPPSPVRPPRPEEDEPTAGTATAPASSPAAAPSDAPSPPAPQAAASGGYPFGVVPVYP